MKHLLTPAAAAFVAAFAFTLATPGAQAAGSVAVTFVQPEKYSDIGRLVSDREHALDVLQRHFASLGARLPDGQTLTVEVLDIDLAGEIQMTPRFGNGETRILKGRADWPRMTLKYTLAAGGQTLRSGQEKLSDMAYTDSRAAPPTAIAGSFYYETRMVDHWFDLNFVPKQSKAK